MTKDTRSGRRRPIAALILLTAGMLGGCATPPPSSQAGPTSAAPPVLAGQTPSITQLADMTVLQRDVDAVMTRLLPNHDGDIYTGAVAGVDADDLAIAVALVDGRQFARGAVETRFPLMSVSKPFTYALALEQRGIDYMLDTIGVSATGMPYNSVTAGAVRPTSEQNPMVNAGAIATHSHIQGTDAAAKLHAVETLYSRMANQTLSTNEAWRATPLALTYVLAYQMQAAGRLDGDVEDVTERYLASNIVSVRANDLAQMGATLANDGVQPLSGERVLAHATVRTVLSAMVIAGMYEDSGSWWTRVGVPAKSGVSGAVVAVIPGWGAIAAYSPRLDTAGNSVRASMAIAELIERWRLHSIDRLLERRQ